MVLVPIVTFFLFAAAVRSLHPSIGEPLAFDKQAVLPLRGILALLVIMGHSFGVVGWGWWLTAYPAVAVFLFVSGFGLTRKYLLSNSCASEVWRGFGKSMLKLLPPFLLASFLYAAWQLIFDKFSIKQLVHNFVVGSSYLPLPFMWYVPAIVILYFLFHLSVSLFRGKRALGFAVMFVLGYWIVTALVFKWPFYWWKAVGGFVAGMLFAFFEDHVRAMVARKGVVLYSVVAVGLIGVWLATFSGVRPVKIVFDHILLAALGPVAAILLYQFRLPSVILDWFGSLSYEFYIVHGAFVIGFESISRLPILYLACVLTCTVLAGFLLQRVERLWQHLR